MRRRRTWKGALALSAALALLGCGCTIGAGIKKKPLELDNRGGEPTRAPVYEQAGWIIARGSIHNHTVYSDGCRSPEDLLEMARMQGMAILAYTDHREGKLCAGKSKSVCVDVGGVESYGYDKYYEHLRKMQAAGAEHDMIVLKGIEVIPYIYNYGKGANAVLDGPQHHFTAYGIEDTSVFENMPLREYVPLKGEPIPDEKPWADFVDYMVDKGAIVHAVHVEEGADMWYGPVHGAAPPPEKNIHMLKNLTGFAVLPMAYKKVSAPGGLWDTTLVEYQAGMRDHALWAAADADYHCDASLAIANTLFYMREYTEREVYSCMRDGRMVAFQGDDFQDVYVTEWWVSDGEPEDAVMLGAHTGVTGDPVARFALSREMDWCKTRLVRNGVVVHEASGTSFTFRDREAGKSREPVYYRVEVIGKTADREINEGDTMPDSRLFANPIFVRFAH